MIFSLATIYNAINGRIFYKEKISSKVLVAAVAGFLLIERIGANRAAYATVLFPIIALVLSSIYEGYVWTWISYIGLIFTLGGIVLINYKPEK